MSAHLEKDFQSQQELVQAWFAQLRQHDPQSRLIETHVSWIVIAGEYAYKIKKALHLGFLDYSDLATRHFYCREEIRLNRRTAPDIYLDVVQIGGETEIPRLHAQPAREYAVKMRCFDNDRQLDRLLSRDELTSSHIDSLAEAIGDFHATLKALPDSADGAQYGAAELQWQLAGQNLQEIRELLADPADIALWETVKQAQLAEFAACRACFGKRQAAGCIRECHGDLHLGNLVAIDGKVVAFDGIDFSSEYRWMDVINDAAFTFMDLLAYGRSAFAWRFMNRYLERTGDYDGVALWRFYAAYRAAVRAKVRLIRLAQESGMSHGRVAADKLVRRYLSLARDLLVRRSPALIITMGLPGSGKTVFSRMAVEKLGAISLRSDVERRRLSEMAGVRYTEQAKQRVYEVLLEKTATLLTVGMTVIVDAAFLQVSRRAAFAELAARRRVPFAIAALSADPDSLYRRVLARQQQGTDASEAGPDVLAFLMDKIQAPTSAESRYVVEFINDDTDGLSETAPGWAILRQRIGHAPSSV